MPKLFRPYELPGPSCLVILFMQSSDSVLSLCLGKTTTSEFIIIDSEPNTTDPHDPNRTPGDSSAGSVVAMANFQVPLSMGTQTSGSFIRPASFTGMVNTISAEGRKTYSITTDTFSLFARSIEDL